MGFTNGTNTGSPYNWQNSTYTVFMQNKYNTTVNSTAGVSGNQLNGNLGLTTDTSGKSGIVAKSNSITKTSQSYKFCIKY